MILVDANLLVYAYVSSFTQHADACEWLDSRLNGTAQVALPWASVLGFLRLVTNRRVFERPASIDDAWRQVTEWLGCDAQAFIPQSAASRATTSGRVASWKTTTSGAHPRITSASGPSRPVPP